MWLCLLRAFALEGPVCKSVSKIKLWFVSLGVRRCHGSFHKFCCERLLTTPGIFWCGNYFPVPYVSSTNTNKIKANKFRSLNFKKNLFPLCSLASDLLFSCFTTDLKILWKCPSNRQKFQQRIFAKQTQPLRPLHFGWVPLGRKFQNQPKYSLQKGGGDRKFNLFKY